MHTVVGLLHSSNPHNKFKVHCFTDSKYTLGSIF